MEARSHVIFGLAGAVVIDSFLHLSGPTLIGHPLPADPLHAADELLLKGIYYGFAALGALTPDIDNARSAIGKRAGFVSRGIQSLAGHRTIFHSIFGLVMVGALIWGAQFALGLALYDRGFHLVGAALGAPNHPGIDLSSHRGVAFVALLVGYFLHLVADSLTIGGVPWLWPNRDRFGFPPERKLRFRSGSAMEPVVVVVVCLLVVAGLVTQVLTL